MQGLSRTATTSCFSSTDWIPPCAGMTETESAEGMGKQPAVYILASQRNGTLYIGVTSDLVQRIWQHRNDCVDGFSKRYQIHFLVHFELHESMVEAISREKQLKKWNRAWKIALIEANNPEWNDLWETLIR